MAETKVAERTESNVTEKVTPRYRVTPRYGLHFADEKWILEVALPGVTKDQIKIKLLEDYFQLRAQRNYILYDLDLEFDFQIEKDKVSAKYVEGLLTVEMTPYNPLDHAFTVPIQ